MDTGTELKSDLKALKEGWRYFLGSGDGRVLLFLLDFLIDRKAAPGYHQWKPKAASSGGSSELLFFLVSQTNRVKKTGVGSASGLSISQQRQSWSPEKLKDWLP